MTYAGTRVITTHDWVNHPYDIIISISLQGHRMSVTIRFFVIVWIPVTQLADPDRVWFLPIAVLEWSLGDRSAFTYNIPREHQRDDWINPDYKIFFDRPHLSFTPTWMSEDFIVCPSNDILNVNKKQHLDVDATTPVSKNHTATKQI